MESDGVPGSTQVCWAPRLSLLPPLHSGSLQWEYIVLVGLPFLAHDRISPRREEEEGIDVPSSLLTPISH